MSTQLLARAFHRSRCALAALTLLAACTVLPEVSPPPARSAAPTAEPDLDRATAPEPALPTISPPAPLLEESEVGNDSGFKPTPGALPTPALAALDAAPTPEVMASIHLPDTGAAPPPTAEPESLLTHLGPTTPPNVAAAMRLIEDGRQHLAQGQYDQAQERFERAVAIDPVNAYGYYYLAQLYFLMKKYDQASAFAGRAVTLATRTNRVWLARAYGLQGAVFEEVGRYADARKAYQKAAQADPNNLAARVGMGRLGGGQ
jgi:hypothetical protein